jgi:HK97 family phage portal protein
MSDELALTVMDAAIADVRRRVELRQKAIQLHGLSQSGNGWWPIIRESFTGAWQSNVELSASTALTYFAVYSCVRLISTDIGKLCLRLVEQDDEGIWSETESPAFSPVIRKPNRYQTINKFVEQWIMSKLIHGNAYVLLQRDQRNVVVAMYVLDPTRVTPLVSYEGAVYYELRRDDLSNLTAETVKSPPSAIIHDTMITPYHPLIGLSPLYASGLAAQQGLSIQGNSNSFFQNGSFPGGIVMVPGKIDDLIAARLKASWETNYGGANMGRVAVLSDGMTYQESGFVNAHDSQLIEQLKLTADQVCSTFGVPPYLVDIGPPPPYANFEPLLLKYHSQCIQSLTTNFEKSLEGGLGLVEKIDGQRYGVEFDIDDLIWMDTATRIAAAKDGIGSGGMSPDEARKKYFGLGSVPGGDTPFMQNQMWPLRQLSERSTPSAPSLPAMPVVGPTDNQTTGNSLSQAASFASLVHKKAVAADLYAA